jgi:hypothetical protein
MGGLLPAYLPARHILVVKIRVVKIRRPVPDQYGRGLRR